MNSKLWLFSLSILLLLLTLTACGSGAAPEAIPTVVLDNSSSEQPASQKSGSDLVASGVVIPSQEANLAFITGGNVTAVNISVGDSVKAGDVLIQLDSVLAELDVARAERTLRELTSSGAIANAEEAAALALETRDDEAHDVEALEYGRASQELLDEVQAEITLAENRVEAAQAVYDRVSHRSLENAGRANALLALNDARNYLNSLRADYNWYLAPPSETDVALTNAEANAAEAAYQEALWYLAALKGEEVPPEASGAMLTQLQQAEADLKAAKKRLEMTRIVAPFDGIIAKVNISVGDFAAPAQPLVIVTDLSQPLIKTTDLSERDILQVQVGAPASVFIEALNETYDAKVVSISPKADTLGGDVIYEVSLSFISPPENLLGGMTAEVTIEEK